METFSSPLDLYNGSPMVVVLFVSRQDHKGIKDRLVGKIKFVAIHMLCTNVIIS